MSNITNYWLSKMHKISSFYIHIPFCHERCHFCKFAMTHRYTDLAKKQYIAALIAEIQVSEESKNKASTIYFGGGTPSVLTKEEIRVILDCFERDKNTEISFECNPEDISESYLLSLKELGINRLSIGIQSLRDDILQKIGRTRTNKENICRGLELVKRYFPNFSIDLIIALPLMQPWDVTHDIELLTTTFDLPHISVYMLESGVYPKAWDTISPDVQTISDEYVHVSQILENLGYEHYEISNWARPWHQCKHNQNYWTHHGYRWYGLSAASLIDNNRILNSSSFRGYYRHEQERENLSEENIVHEKIIFGFRTFSLDENLCNNEHITELCETWFMERNNGKISPTLSWILQENHILWLL